MLYHFQTTGTPNALKVDSVKTDLDTALTFTQIARQTVDPDKAMRNRRTARGGYDGVLSYLGSASLSRPEQEHFTKKLALLKTALRSLGEVFLGHQQSLFVVVLFLGVENGR